MNNNSKKYKKQLFMGIVFLAVLFGGWFFPLIGFFIPVCMLLGIGIAFFKGRKWCDWFCPRGSFFDSVMKKFSPQKKIPSIFKKLSLRMFVLSYLMTIMTLQIIKYWPDPYKIGIVFMTLLSVTTFIGIILGFIFHQRTWCYVCPVGTLSNLAGKNKYPLKFNPNNCVNCNLCEKSCPVQLEPNNKTQDQDCLKCNSCVQACPNNALDF